VSRTLSSALLQAINAEETGDAILFLVKIDHANLASPIRVTSDGVDTTSNGNTFTACPFEFQAAAEEDETEMVATLRVDNVDREIVSAVRSISTPASVTVQVVRAADPDMVEVEWPDFDLINAEYDMLKVSGKISVESWTQEPYPADKFDPARFPGQF